MSSHFLQRLFAEDLSWGLPSQAFARRIIETITDLFDVMICHRTDVAFAWQPAPGPTIGILNGSFLLGRGWITEPRLRPDLSLQVWPTDKLGATVKRNRFARNMEQVFDCFDDLTHDRLGAFVGVLQDGGEAAYTFDLSCNIRLAKLLFEQHQITFPVTKLAAVGHIIGPKQDADIAVELRLSSSTRAPWTTGDTMGWQVPP